MSFYISGSMNIVILALLITGVVFINGFTDAPNSVSGVISSGIWSKRKACLISGISNVAGVVGFTLLGGKVAESVVNLSKFGKNAYPCICACLTGVILFGIISWTFAMPSSESHALISCIFGASLASSVKAELIPFVSILIYTVFSCVFTLILSLFLSRRFKKTEGECIKYEKFACVFSSAAHGAQDGQKFMALYIILLPLKSLSASVPYVILAFTVGAFMMAGTILGGGKIINSLGNEIVKNDAKIAFLSDFSSTVCVFLCSLLGFSVSTGNIKACSLVGAGLGCKRKINTLTVKRIFLTSVITFPICIFLGFALTMLFVRIF